MAGTPMRKWYVYLGKLITAAFYDPDMTAAEVKKALVEHDHFNPNITVREVL